MINKQYDADMTRNQATRHYRLVHAIYIAGVPRYHNETISVYPFFKLLRWYARSYWPRGVLSSEYVNA